MPPPTLFLKENKKIKNKKSEEMNLGEDISAFLPPAHPASEDYSNYSSQGKTLGKPA